MKNNITVILTIISLLFRRVYSSVYSLVMKCSAHLPPSFSLLFLNNPLSDNSLPVDQLIVNFLDICAKRQRRLLILYKTLLGIFVAEITTIAFLITDLFRSDPQSSFSLIAILFLLGISGGFFFGLVTSPTDRTAIARKIDEQFGWKDQILTALFLIQSRHSAPLSEIQRTASAELLKTISHKDIPYLHNNRSLIYLVLSDFIFLTLCLCIFSYNNTITTSVTPPSTRLVVLSNEVRQEISRAFKNVPSKTPKGPTSHHTFSSEIDASDENLTNHLDHFSEKISNQLDVLEKSSSQWKETLQALSQIKETIRQTIAQIENIEESRQLKQLGTELSKISAFSQIGKALKENNWSKAFEELEKIDLKTISENDKKEVSDLFRGQSPDSVSKNDPSSENNSPNINQDLVRKIQNLKTTLKHQEIRRTTKESLQNRANFITAKQSIISDALLAEQIEANNIITTKNHFKTRIKSETKTMSDKVTKQLDQSDSSDQRPGRSTSDPFSIKNNENNNQILSYSKSNNSKNYNSDNNTTYSKTDHSELPNTIKSVSTSTSWDQEVPPPSEIEIFSESHSDHHFDNNSTDRSENTTSKKSSLPFRQIWKEYQKKNEAILESEPIPPEKRRIIQQYFESIRPTDDKEVKSI